MQKARAAQAAEAEKALRLKQAAEQKTHPDSTRAQAGDDAPRSDLVAASLAHRPRGPPLPDAESRAMTIDTFCRRYGNFSKATFYNLLKRGQAPRLMRVGRLVLISVEEAEAWRARMESRTSREAIKKEGAGAA
jgi:predicted DNA-binding transcriptional regulator AlpA